MIRLAKVTHSTKDLIIEESKLLKDQFRTQKFLEILFPLLEKNGILIIDDYGHWKGSKRAVDDYFKNDLNFKFFHRIDYASRLYIKE